ncbi:MAG: multicopper oxidase family protein [Spirochaetaceae bacterium]|nr:multicopper oxidase family protein [Spirochaetaceae bacterium]
MSSRLRLLLACLASAVIVVPLGWMWWSSLLPDTYSVVDMGYVDLGSGPAPAGAPGHNAMDSRATSIRTLRADPARPADVRVDLVARRETFELASGRRVDGYTLNGGSPGPTIRAQQGDQVEVRLDNANVPDGITLHWHGIDVPNSMDGVAGVTQDAILAGDSFTYRYVADQVGTYWYHSHQLSHEQVRRGLLGAVVVVPKNADPEILDVPALVHLYDGLRTVNGEEGDVSVDAAPGSIARVRVINTDNGPMTVWVSGSGYRILAVDGTDVNEATPVKGKGTLVTAGGRADIEIVVPDGGARVELGGSTALLLGPGASELPADTAPTGVVDLLTYGSPAPLGFDPKTATRRFEYVVGRRPGFHDGRPGLWWTVNGHMFPDVPMFTVAEGDVVRMRIENNSGDVHPMHLHGHHAVVLRRDGVPATGSPWWVDSLNVRDGESYDVAFVADNPGIWMDHCHNLPHAAEGLVAHLMYAGFTTPFMIGGTAANHPE